MAVVVSPDRRRLLTLHKDQTLRLRELPSGEEKARFARLNFAGGFSFSPDGRYVASGGRASRVYLYKLPDRTGTASAVPQPSPASVGHHPEHTVWAAAISPDGRFALTGAGDPLKQDHTLRAGSNYDLCLWDVTTGEQIRRLVGHKDNVYGVVFTSDGKRALSGSADRTVRLWDGATGKELERIDGFANAVLHMAFSADGQWALTGSDDGTARLWDVAGGKEQAVLRAGREVFRQVALSPDGRLAATAGLDTVFLWDARTGKEL